MLALICRLAGGDQSTSVNIASPSGTSNVNPALSSGDFGQVVKVIMKRKLTNEERYSLLTSHFHPSSTNHIPTVVRGSQKRSFQHSWLAKYIGLVYSELDQGGYCKYCILLGKPPSSVSNFVGVLTTRPLPNLQKASVKLCEHFTGVGSNSARKYHLAAIAEAESFKSVMEKKQLPVNQMLSRVRLQQITEKGKKSNLLWRPLPFVDAKVSLSGDTVMTRNTFNKHCLLTMAIS